MSAQRHDLRDARALGEGAAALGRGRAAIDASSDPLPEVAHTRREVTSPSLALVIATYEDPAGLESCLLGVGRQSRPPDRVVVADDGSGPETGEVVERHRRHLALDHVWQPDDGFRLAAVRNRAIALCREDYLVFLDGDTVPHRHFVRDHLAFARRDRVILGQRCGLVGLHGAVVRAEPTVPQLLWLFLRRRVLNDSHALKAGLRGRLTGLRKGLRLPWPLLQPGTLGIVHGGNLGLWRDDALEVNGFDERFIGWGAEDCDFADRLRRLGRRLYRLEHRALCYHLDHPARARNAGNRALLESAARPTRCVLGVDRHGAAQA